jgi:hypothetical protein
MNMELFEAHIAWAQMKSEVVAAAEELMQNPTDMTALATLGAMLVAEKTARAKFEAAFAAAGIER